MNAQEYVLSEGEAEAVLASLSRHRSDASDTDEGWDMLQGARTSDPTADGRIAAIEAAEARMAASALGGATERVDGDPFGGVSQASDPRQDVQALGRLDQQLQARFYDDEDPFVTLWHSDGQNSRVPRLAVNRYLQKRDYKTGQRVFFRVPPPGVQPVELTIPCLVEGCPKKFPNEIQQLAHAEVYHTQEMNYLIRSKQLRSEERGEEDRSAERQDRQLMQALLMAIVAKDPSMADVVKSFGIELS